MILFSKFIFLITLFGVLFFSCNPPQRELLIIKVDKIDSVAYLDSICSYTDSIDFSIRKEKIKRLISAVWNNELDTIKKIVEQGVDVNGKIHHYGYPSISALGESVRLGNYEVVKYLIDHGADPNLNLGRGLTPFQQSTGRCSGNIGCSLEIFNLLLEKGGQVNSYNRYQDATPLSLAIGSQQETVVNTLINKGAVTTKDSTNGYRSPLFKSIYTLNHIIISALLEHGANVNETFTEGYGDCILTCPEEITAIHLLVLMSTYSDLVKINSIFDLLLSKSPDINALSALDKTALDFAVYLGNEQLVNKLINLGAKIQSEKRSAVNTAAQFSNYKMLDHLLHYKPDLKSKEERSIKPALQLSMECCGDGFGEGITQEDRVKTIKLLLDYGADPNEKDYEGNSFIEIAKKNWYPNVTVLLINRGLLKNSDLVKENQ